MRGLETGADDCMVKPYSIVELMAPVRSQLRRVPPRSDNGSGFEDIVLDSQTCEVTRADGPLKVSPTASSI